jgi:DNA-binding NarL/FixJ family response regulator
MEPTTGINAASCPKCNHPQSEHEPRGGCGRPITPNGLADQLLERRLTQVRIRLLQLLAHGYDLKEAAVELGIKHGTARNYCRFIKDALGADTIAQAVILGIRRGIIQ